MTLDGGNTKADFPFKCGKATVYEDRVIVKKGYFRKTTQEIQLENIKNIRYINHAYWLEISENRLLTIGSPKRETLRKLKAAWHEVFLR